jgi:O-succinylbenzoic acid--CoA ligase
MDPALLMDPGFWLDERPCVPAGSPPAPVPDPSAPPGQVWFATSGSSGPPKWLALAKSGLLVSAAAVNAHLKVTADSCWGLALPLHHVGGFGVVARAFEAGCGLSRFEGRWAAAAFREWLEATCVTHTSLVPTQVHDLVAAGLGAPPLLRVIVVGGGHLDPATGRAARALGWPVLASYGMTEASSQIATQPLAALEHPYQSAPLAVLPIWRTRVARDGRLSIAGPALFSGALVAAAGGWRYHPRSGDWHATADRVALADGQLTPLGRLDSLVKVLGELVDPATIEAELLALGRGAVPAGAVAVAAVPDERAGHRLVPVVEAGVSPDVIAEVLAAYHRQAPGFRRLQAVVRVAGLPRSPLGKLRRAELADLAGPATDASAPLESAGSDGG